MDPTTVANELTPQANLLRRRVGVVVSVDRTACTATVTVGGSDLDLPYMMEPVAGDQVVILADGSDWLILGAIKPTPTVPAGVMIDYGGSSAPDGWLLCDGAAVSRSTYPGLFSAIGTTYGSGDGSTTFNLPDARGRFLVGADDDHELGDTGGSTDLPEHSHSLPGHTHTVEAHTHTVDAHTHTVDAHTHSTPSHSHNIPSHTHSFSDTSSGPTGTAIAVSGGTTNFVYANNSHTHTVSGTTGGTVGHTTGSGGASTTGSGGGGNTGSGGGGNTGSAGAGNTGTGGSGSTGESSSDINSEPPWLAVHRIIKT